MAQPGDPDAQPLRGVVLCCTSLAPDARTNLAHVASQMGAVHKLDLTSDVTHLLVGNIDTPKYRYVAKDRPDIRVLFPDFIEAVRKAWMGGEEVDVAELEKQHSIPPFMGLQVCVTGFDDLTQRKGLETTLVAKGATYHGDLTRSVTHLIAARPEGAKYTHALQWDIRIVSLKWYEDCITRGMAVDESLYNPQLPREQQGVGAFRTTRRTAELGKRGREDDDSVAGDESSRRKLRKVASTRLDSQSQDMWRSISQAEPQVDTTLLDAWNGEDQTLQELPRPPPARKTERSRPINPEAPQGLFSGCFVLIYGFSAGRAKKLRAVMQSNGASIVTTVGELERASHEPDFEVCCLLVPHDLPTMLSEVPPGTLRVTEWWAERCLHYKQQLSPESDTLSRPLSDARVSGFQKFVISTTGFSGVDLRQIAEVVKLMGATYQEQLLPSTTILVCALNTVKKEKAFYANKYRIAAVSASWLWDSLESKTAVPMDKYKLKLEAPESTELAEGLSNSMPAPSATRLDVRQSSNHTERADEYAHPKRLSTTRKRYAPPSLMLKASKPVPTGLRMSKAGPFVLEDDDEVAWNDDVPQPPSQDGALREISPNASQQRSDHESQEGHVKEFCASGGIFQEREVVTHGSGPVSSPKLSPKSAKRNAAEQSMEQAAKARDEDGLTNDLASILQRRRWSKAAKAASKPLKRKHRPLGRNLSGVSNRSGSASASPALPAEPPESVSLADGFYVSREELVQAPPGTQLGYETPEEQAHRLQMSKKMGTTLLEEGTRLTTVATIKDSADIVVTRATRANGATGRAKVRNRGKV